MNGFRRLTFGVALVLLLQQVGCQNGTKKRADADSLDGLEQANSTSSADAEADALFSELDKTENVNSSGENLPMPSPPPDQAIEPMLQANSSIESTAQAAQSAGATIQSIDFKANENSGTLVIRGSSALTYRIRQNKKLNQFVVEIPNSVLPTRLQRPLIAKDMPGSIGSIQAYQDTQSSTSNVVLQLKGERATQPMVQMENGAILVMMEPEHSSNFSEATAGSNNKSGDIVASQRLTSSNSLDDFLRSNSRFYGKKISLEFDDIELRDVFKLIAEEAGINLIIADEIKGKMSLKLREVPWDQAMILIMRSRKLGYTRSGNVLRIANQAEIRQEEDDAVRAEQAMKDTAPLKVKLIPISYSPVAEIEKQIKPFLSKRGSVSADARTSAVIVSDIDENIDRVQKLITGIDIPPTQVLIEGKIVEASDQFERRFGINWNFTGKQVPVGSQNLLAPFNVSPVSSSSGGAGAATFSFNPTFGSLDVLGDLTASLSLYEREGAVKVLSSPRVVALHNEPASISQSVAIPVVSSTMGPGGVPVNSVTYRDAKLSLNVTANVTNDGGVIMNLDVSRDVPGEIDPTTGQRPINSRSAKTKVLIRNSQTAVIGGIYQNDTSESENRVPGLGNLPVVGWLFKSKTRDVRKNELLIFLTPKILAQSTPGLEFQRGATR